MEGHGPAWQQEQRSHHLPVEAQTSSEQSDLELLQSDSTQRAHCGNLETPERCFFPKGIFVQASHFTLTPGDVLGEKTESLPSPRHLLQP